MGSSRSILDAVTAAPASLTSLPADDSPTNDSTQIPPETSSEDVKVEEPFSQDDLPF